MKRKLVTMEPEVVVDICLTLEKGAEAIGQYRFRGPAANRWNGLGEKLAFAAFRLRQRLGTEGAVEKP